MDLPSRRSIRLKGYDYSSNGVYFITICTQNRELLFGEIINGEMMLNKTGEIVQQFIESLTSRFPIEIPIYQIMPNHIHMIIMIVGAIHESPDFIQRAHRDVPLQNKRSLLSQIIGYLKMNSAKSIHQYHNISVWQRNYYEHIIRNDAELDKISWYIKNNPGMWDRDRNNPKSKHSAQII